METLGSLVGFGNYGRVYRLASDQTKVVKIPHYWTWELHNPLNIRTLAGFTLDRSGRARQKLAYETKLNECMHSQGLSIPRPFGMVDVMVEQGGTLQGFVAEYVLGKTLKIVLRKNNECYVRV